MVIRARKTDHGLGLEQILIDSIQRLLRADPAAVSDPGELHKTAVSSLVDELLSGNRPSYCSRFQVHDPGTLASSVELTPQALAMTSEEVGQAYEYLRGLRIQLTAGADPALVPSARGKRNQGLFYTPKRVVKFIVENTLDALQITRPEDHLDLKILDPAVGTGAFIIEALEQLTHRVLVSEWSKAPRLRNRIDEIIASAQEKFSIRGKRVGLDAHTAVRMHILENCLYGVDVDPIAVAIARHTLLEKACTHFSLWPEITLQIRVGNSLMGEGMGKAGLSTNIELDSRHAKAYFGPEKRGPSEIAQWCESKRVFHWPIEYPECFGNTRQGFDAVIGNPPYEIVSVKESGLSERSAEQRYFRRTFRTCRGKINTYRLMLERGLNLLADAGTLGFILPATLAADSSASAVRQMVLENSEIKTALLIPEKAQIFEGVTQSLLILVLRKGFKTRKVRPTFWDGKGNIPKRGTIEIPRALIDAAGLRIPLLRSEDEKRLLELVSRHPSFKGTDRLPPLGFVHQGEINLTVHRRFITALKTGFPLIRGEHVMPFRVVHPSSRPGRLDWVVQEYAQSCRADQSPPGGNSSQCAFDRKRLAPSPQPSPRGRGSHIEQPSPSTDPWEPDYQSPLLLGEGQGEGPRFKSGSVSCATSGTSNSGARRRPWEKERIVLGRVVNMATSRRLKAAAVPAGVFLGDMTNFIADTSTPRNYLLGLLNSSLLNWRLKITSTNNYLSAAEIESLPMPRIPPEEIGLRSLRSAQMILKPVMDEKSLPLVTCLETLKNLFGRESPILEAPFISKIIQWLVEEILRVESASEARKITLTNLLDAMILKLYGIEPWPGLIRLLESP